MTLNIGKHNLSLMISAVRDAIMAAQRTIDDPATAEIEDWEEYLVGLSNLEHVLESEYRRLEKLDPLMIPFDTLFKRTDG